MEESLTVLYTGRLHGNLDLLPRLFTFLRNLRAEHAGDGKTLLLDVGESCAREVWHCAVTGGRSTLYALDGMGFHAANGRGVLLPGMREKLNALANIVVLDDDLPVTLVDDVPVTLKVLPTIGYDGIVSVCLTPTTDWQLDGGLLQLRGVEAGQVGVARVMGERLVGAAIYDMPPSTPPDPTIAGIIEFVVSEARYTQKRKGNGATHSEG